MTMNPCITSRTVTGPGLKSRPPMATYCEPSQRALSRARLSAHQQRAARERRELENVLDSLDWESTRHIPQSETPAPRKTESAGPDPLLTAAFVAGVIAGATVALMFGVRG